MSHVAVLCNPTAGRGRGAAARDVALSRLRAAGHDVVELSGAEESPSAAPTGRAVPDDVEALVVVGGDGLINRAAQLIAGTGVPLGIIAAGTGNDAARALDLPRADPLAATDRVVAALAQDRRRRIDLACAQGRYFVTVLCAGIDARVAERANTLRWPRGQLRYTVAVVAELRTFRPILYTLDLDGRSVQTEAMMVSVGNTASFGGGLRITEGAKTDDGLLDVVVIEPMSKPALLRTYPRLFSGTHTSHPAYAHHRVRSVTVAAAGVVAYADGERFGPLPMTVTCRPGALEVLV